MTSNPQESSSHGSHGREGLAGAAATATVLGASHAISKSEENNVKHQGAEPRQATYGDGPSITASSTTVPPATVRTPLRYLFDLARQKSNNHVDSNGLGCFEPARI